MTLTEAQIQRYSRQILLKEIGGAGQARLLQSTVLMVGAGGLGSPAALYLAASGVGRLIIADGDRVELSNLHRQILHGDQDIGRPKAVSARESLEALNPDVTVEAVEARLEGENIDHWVAACDVVVDGSDNFATRYRVNQACHRAKKPLVFGSVLGFEGQAALFLSGLDPLRPCYQCLFPEPPPPGSAPSCASAGVLAPAAGLIGAIQAAEAIKRLLGLAPEPETRLLLVNLIDGLFHGVTVRKDPRCPVCGDPG